MMLRITRPISPSPLSVCSVQLGWNLNIFINDVATARKVMHHNCVGVERPPFANPPLLMHFLAINGEKWKQRRGHFTSQVAAKVANSQYSYDIIQDAITNSIVPDLDRIVATDGLWYPARHCSFIDMNLMFNVLYGFNLSLNEDPTGYVDQLLPVPEIWFKSITNGNYGGAGPEHREYGELSLSG